MQRSADTPALIEPCCILTLTDIGPWQMSDVLVDAVYCMLA